MMYTTMTGPENQFSISVYGCTDTGRQRPNNEDAFLVIDLSAESSLTAGVTGRDQDERGSLLVVADGMGGAMAGEVASAMAVATLHEVLLARLVEPDTGEQLKRATETANQCIWAQAQQDISLRGMGSTLTAALVQQSIAYISQVGDSRAYLLRGERIRQLTRDQSLVQFLLDMGEITPEQAAHHPNKNVIFQALGTDAKVKPEMLAVELCRDDCLILCSDGLSNLVTPAEILQANKLSPDPESASKSLVELANLRGGEDNITVIVARFDGECLRASNEAAITASLHMN
jgi:PPM family protein phosphatase